MRAIVTGGAGFIGSALVRRLVGDGHAVLNVDKLTYAGRLETVASVSRDPNYSFLRADVADAMVMTRACAEFGPNVVFHLAAETHVDRSVDHPAAFVETNVGGTCAMLEAALRYWSGLEGEARRQFRFMQVSTDEVYGSLGREGHFCEDSAYRPNSPYAASKAAGDHLANAWFVTYGLPVLVSNCSNNYGPFQHPEKLIPTVLRHALASSPIPVYGDGSNCRDWLYVDDHVDGLLRLCERGKPGEKYLFGARTNVNNVALVEMLCGILDHFKPRSQGGSYASQISFVDDRPGHDFRYAIDPAKAERELDWAVRRALPGGLQETVSWYLEHPAWLVRPDAELRRLGLARGVERAR